MQLERLFAYDDWANREELKRLREIENRAPGLRLLNHIVGGDWLWIARINGEKPKFDVWPELSIEQAAAELDPIRDAWRKILAGDRDRVIKYENSKGEPWSSTVDEILAHIVIHSAYHRGQIATVVRQGGETPAYTDFIHAARNKFA